MILMVQLLFEWCPSSSTNLGNCELLWVCGDSHAFQILIVGEILILVGEINGEISFFMSEINGWR
jgi:hypothetical protein